MYAIIPNLFQTLESSRSHDRFLLETAPQVTVISTGALLDDVEAGRALEIGQSIRKQHVIEPTGIFFDKVVRTDPEDPSSAKRGQGRFHAELWILSWLGIDFTGYSKATLVAIRFFFDALFPFLLLFLLSAFTRPVGRKHMDRFFGKIHTPVQPSKAEEQVALEAAATHPEMFEPKKLLPGTSWEILKPGWIDVLGFGGCWLLVGVVVLALWLLVNIGG